MTLSCRVAWISILVWVNKGFFPYRKKPDDPGSNIKLCLMYSNPVFLKVRAAPLSFKREKNLNVAFSLKTVETEKFKITKLTPEVIQVKMAKVQKIGSTRRFGARYGRKVKERVDAIEKVLKGKHKCPYCSQLKVKRVSAGIWFCNKCKSKFTGRAYSLGKKIVEEEAPTKEKEEGVKNG